MTSRDIRAWSVAVLAVAGGFLAAGVLGALVATWFDRWDLPASGFAAAFGVVLAAYLAAPSRRLAFSVCAFAVGAGVATWMFRDGSSYPESYSSLAYQLTYLPLWLTLAGGAMGLLCVLALEWRQRE